MLVGGSLAVFGISVALTLYRRRLEEKVRKIKREAERLEVEKAKVSSSLGHRD